MRISIISIFILIPFLVHAEPFKPENKFQINCDINIKDGIVNISAPYISIDGRDVACHCGKRSISISIEKGKTTGKCLDHSGRTSCVSCESPACNVALDKPTKKNN